MLRKIPYYKLLLFVLLIIGVFAQDSTLVVNMIDKNDILYLKDGTFIECIHTLSVSEGFDPLELRTWTKVNCDEVTYEIELVDKMVLKDGRVTSNQDLINNTKKVKYWYYSITSSIVVLLVIITA